MKNLLQKKQIRGIYPLLKKFGFLISALIIVFTVSNFLGINKASAAGVYCDGYHSPCADAQMYWGQQQYVASGSIYLYRGQTAYYEWGNDNSGLMQVSFAIYNSSGQQVSPALVAAGSYSGGDNWDTWTVPSDGYYYLFAACEGGNDTRCVGSGLIEHF